MSQAFLPSCTSEIFGFLQSSRSRQCRGICSPQHPHLDPRRSAGVPYSPPFPSSTAHHTCPCLIPKQAVQGGTPWDVWTSRNEKHARPSHSLPCWLKAGEHSGQLHSVKWKCNRQKEPRQLSDFKSEPSQKAQPAFALLGVWVHNSPGFWRPQSHLQKPFPLDLITCCPNLTNTIITGVESHSPTCLSPITHCTMFAVL